MSSLLKIWTQISWENEGWGGPDHGAVAIIISLKGLGLEINIFVKG
jgi:hypothetical protein